LGIGRYLAPYETLNGARRPGNKASARPAGANS
jgi:hypothetical protein